MSTPPQDPNQPQDPNRKPYDDGNQDQPARQQEDQPQEDRPQYGRPQYGENAPGSGQPQSGQPQYGQPQYGQPAPGYGQPGPDQQPPMGQQYPAGQPPYGQDPGAQPPYGYPSGQPAAYGYPGGQSQFAQQGPVPRPREVEISFWLIIAAAVLTAVTIIATLAALGSPAMMERFEMIMSQQGGEVPMDTEALVGIAATTIVIIGIIGVALYLLIGFMVRKGKNWARITATVLAALSLLTMIGAGFLWIITVLLGVAAVVLLFMPKSSYYFNAIKARKLGAYGR